MRRAATLVATAGLALAGCGGSGEKPAATTTKVPAASGPAAVLKAFYASAARGDSAAACALLAPKADAGNATASLLIAGTDAATFTPVTDCASTVSDFYRAHPTLLRRALPAIRLVATGAPGKVDISRSGSGIKFHATLVQVGGQWRILEVVV
jgi:hypothetical protein